MLDLALKKAVLRTCHHKALLEVMDYAVFPPGKLFRPKLVEAMALDLAGKLTQDHLHLASAIELHHAYTLVHDDLPSMDNDLIRRGRPSTHAQFGEWKAVLAGDALLIASFHELSFLENKNFRKIYRLMAWASGAKGLIDGQFRDLLSDGKLDFTEIVRIHELKTARLIQLATLGVYLLEEDQTLRGKIEFLKLGREIGVSFQLLDDLSELTDSEISSHEKNINPFITSPREALNELQLSHQRLKAIIQKHNLRHLDSMLQEYFKNSQLNLLRAQSNLERNCPGNKEVLKDWITSFV